MRCVIQRVRSASVRVENELVAQIGHGLLILAGVEKKDEEATMVAAALKIRQLRIFSDENGRMNLDIAQAGGEVLAVSQFTLAGSIDRGRRPSFDGAEEPGRARELFERFCDALAEQGVRVQRGRFREMMVVTLENDGPVTFVYESKSRD